MGLSWYKQRPRQFGDFRHSLDPKSKLGSSTRRSRSLGYQLLRSSLLAAGLLSSPRAWAESPAPQQGPNYPTCTEEPSESDVAAAQGAYQAGQVSFQEADYERTLLYWEDAFRRDCTAIKLLLNLARAYELSGQKQSAVNALQTYVTRAPAEEDTSSVEKRIEKLQQQLDAEQAAAAPESLSEPDDAQNTTAQDTPAVQDRPSRTWEAFTGGGLLLAGFGLVVPGSIIWAISQKDISDEKDAIAALYNCTRKGLNWNCDTEAHRLEAQTALDDSQVIANAQKQRTTGIILTTAGSALVVGGSAFLVHYLVKGSKDHATVERPLLAPVFAPGYSGLTLSGTF